MEYERDSEIIFEGRGGSPKSSQETQSTLLVNLGQLGWQNNMRIQC